jgi:hypothetical protein
LTGRWFLLFALPILICALVFQALLVLSEDLRVNFLTGERPASGAPFLVAVGTGITARGAATPTLLDRFSFLPFALDVLVTAAIAFVIAWFLRIRNAWPPSAVATAAIGLMLLSASSSPPPIRSFGFSFWIYWVVAFALTSALWTGFELYRARPNPR